MKVNQDESVPFMMQVAKIAAALEGQWEAMKLMACSEAHALELQAQVSASTFMFATIEVITMALRSSPPSLVEMRCIMSRTTLTQFIYMHQWL